MPTNWNEINDRRIGEKKQELLIYCGTRRDSLTQKAFELARESLKPLLRNLMDRDSGYEGIPNSVWRSMEIQDEVIAKCSEKEAEAMAKTIVYKGIADDLNLYPITAEQKIQRAKKQNHVCSIRIDEMTLKDMFFVVRAHRMGESISPTTMQPLYLYFKDSFDFTPYMVQVYSFLRFSSGPLNIRAMPGYSSSSDQYITAARELLRRGYISQNDNEYALTNKKLEKE